MCDVGVQTLVMNGYAAKCIMLNKDVRHLGTAAKADGTPADMDQKADIAVFEVGLLMYCELVDTRHGHTNPGAAMLPCAEQGCAPYAYRWKRLQQADSTLADDGQKAEMGYLLDQLLSK